MKNKLKPNEKKWYECRSGWWQIDVVNYNYELIAYI